MAKKKSNQVTIAAILAIAAILFLSYLSHTGYATFVRDMMGPRPTEPTPIAEIKTEEPAVAQEVHVPTDLTPEIRYYYNPATQWYCVEGYVRNAGPGDVPKNTMIINNLYEDRYGENHLLATVPMNIGGMKAYTVNNAGLSDCGFSVGIIRLDVDAGKDFPETDEANNYLDAIKPYEEEVPEVPSP